MIKFRPNIINFERISGDLWTNLRKKIWFKSNLKPSQVNKWSSFVQIFSKYTWFATELYKNLPNSNHNLINKPSKGGALRGWEADKAEGGGGVRQPGEGRGGEAEGQRVLQEGRLRLRRQTLLRGHQVNVVYFIRVTLKLWQGASKEASLIKCFVEDILIRHPI